MKNNIKKILFFSILISILILSFRIFSNKDLKTTINKNNSEIAKLNKTNEELTAKQLELNKKLNDYDTNLEEVSSSIEHNSVNYANATNRIVNVASTLTNKVNEVLLKKEKEESEKNPNAAVDYMPGNTGDKEAVKNPFERGR